MSFVRTIWKVEDVYYVCVEKLLNKVIATYKKI